jgi:4-hydroxythreonine-4-phosphate dehydrogenase
MRPRLALVPGEPAGIGPELVVRALQRDWDAQLTVFGDRASLAAAAHSLGLPLPPHLALVDIANAVPATPGTPDPRNAPMVVDALQRAARGCLDGDFDGLVTGPVHKGVINDAGILFTGTTGLLARQAGCEVVMMLANPGMRVALQTVHLPLRAVPDAITAEALASTLRIVDASLRHAFGIAEPTIAVLGLNPHAGEDGHLGHEERDVIAPALARLRGEGMRLVGPLPADTAFLPAKLAGFDAVLAMYHDQGLPVLKHSDFANAVNLTLGLPYPRVAVDHGTALDLAGTGTADPSSLFAAIRTCARLATASARPRPAP